MTSKLVNLIEEESFKLAVSKLGGAKRIDRALEAYVCALARKPEAYEIVPGWKTLRIAKTNAIELSENSIPPLIVWFRIDDKGNVRLLWIEENKKFEEENGQY
jgi:hypothetical protein